MELIDSKTAKILSQYPLYSQEEKGDNAIAVIKFFLPGTAWTWYVTEGERMENGDWHLFGLVTNPYEEKELGYFLSVTVGRNISYACQHQRGYSESSCSSRA